MKHVAKKRHGGRNLKVHGGFKAEGHKKESRKRSRRKRG